MKCFNSWWFSLEQGRRDVLIEDKWMLANAYGDYVAECKDAELKRFRRFTRGVCFTMKKAKKHNTLTSHDNEMLRQQIEAATKLLED